MLPSFMHKISVGAQQLILFSDLCGAMLSGSDTGYLWGNYGMHCNRWRWCHGALEPRAHRTKNPCAQEHVPLRAEFEPLAKHIIVVLAPGYYLAERTDYSFQKLREGVRLKPLGDVFYAQRVTKG